MALHIFIRYGPTKYDLMLQNIDIEDLSSLINKRKYFITIV